ncbi:MAG: energy transducer TonB [Blastocatellales bacterium]
MKINRTISLATILLVTAASLFAASRQQPDTKAGAGTTTPKPKPAPAQLLKQSLGQSSKTAPGSGRKTDASVSKAAVGAKSGSSVAELIKQGKALYRSQRFKPALAKFETALQMDPGNDEALGLAAVTAFRLDSQPQSRDYFVRRASLPGQKDSVKAFSYYRVALTHWREVHDLVAKFSEVIEDKAVVTIPEENQSSVQYGIESGLAYADKALAISNNFAEACNVKNLLHAEAALAASDEETASEHRKKSIESLRRAIELSRVPAGAKEGDVADFSLPTIRVSEFAHTNEEENRIEDPIKKLITGGKPVKRTQALFPSVRPSKSSDQNDPLGKGVTSGGGAYSLGAGRGALTAAYTPGIVKIEVLISTAGDVVFAHIVEGRSDLNGAAILAARAWKFEPAKFEGKPVQVSGVITFDMKPGRKDKGKGGQGDKGATGQGDKGTRRQGDRRRNLLSVPRLLVSLPPPSPIHSFTTPIYGRLR